jgi:hypothetical protein
MCGSTRRSRFRQRQGTDPGGRGPSSPGSSVPRRSHQRRGMFAHGTHGKHGSPALAFAVPVFLRTAVFGAKSGHKSMFPCDARATSRIDLKRPIRLRLLIIIQAYQFVAPWTPAGALPGRFFRPKNVTVSGSAAGCDSGKVGALYSAVPPARCRRQSSHIHAAMRLVVRRARGTRINCTAR